MIYQTIHQPSIPSSTLSTPSSQSTPAAPTQTLPEHLEKHNATSKKECNYRGKNICPFKWKMFNQIRNKTRPGYSGIYWFGV